MTFRCKIGLLLLALIPGVMHAQTTISWGTGFVVDEMVESDGVTEVTPSGYTIALGTFGSFTPTENNIEDWASNWKVLDVVSSGDSDSSDRFFDFSGTDGAFLGGDTLNANQTSASSDASGATFSAGEQVYVWVYNTQSITETSEWALYTQYLDGECDNCIDGAWQIPNASSTSVPPNFYLSEADTALYGSINDQSSIGMGDYDASPATSHFQTHSGGRGNYWDLNGSTAGSAAAGTTATWNSSNTNWNKKADGTNPTKKFKKNSVAVFSAGDDADGSTYTVVKEGNEDVFGLDFENGDSITIAHGTGGSITFDRNGKHAFHETDGTTSVHRKAFINVDTGVEATIETVLAGSEDVRKIGNGTLVMAGNTVSTLTGKILLEEGTLQMSGTGTSPRLNTDIKIDGGTLLISETNPTSDNQFGSSTDIEYTHGLFQVGEANESLGTLNLTLSEDSTLDMTGDGTTSKIFFADSSSEDWSDSGGNLLIIENWDGIVNYGGGNDQVFFGSDINGLTGSQVSRIKFLNPAGKTGTFDAIILSTGEVVPFSYIPEPSTYIGGFAMAGMLLGHGYRRYRRRQRAESLEGDQAV